MPLAHLPCLDTTIASSGSSPESSIPTCTMHIKDRRPPCLLCLSATYLCKIWLGGSPQSPPPTLTLDTTTLFRPHVLPSPPWSSAPPDSGTLSGPWASPRSPPSYRFHRVTQTTSLPCTLILGPAMLLPPSLESLLSYPTASKICTGLGILPLNCCCWMRSPSPSIGTPWTVVRSQLWYGTIPYFPRSSVVGSRAWGAFTPPAYTSPTCSGGYWASLLALVSHSACT